MPYREEVRGEKRGGERSMPMVLHACMYAKEVRVPLCCSLSLV